MDEYKNTTKQKYETIGPSDGHLFTKWIRDHVWSIGADTFEGLKRELDKRNIKVTDEQVFKKIYWDRK